MGSVSMCRFLANQVAMLKQAQIIFSTVYQNRSTKDFDDQFYVIKNMSELFVVP